MMLEHDALVAIAGADAALHTAIWTVGNGCILLTATGLLQQIGLILI